MRGAGRAFTLACAASLSGAIAVNSACEHLDTPCRTTDEVLIAEVSGAATRGVFAAVEQASLAVLFFVRDSAPEGGTLGLPDRVEIVVLDPEVRTEARRESFSPPPRLAARRGSTDSVGVAWSPGQALFHWVEITTSTEPDGQTRTASRLLLQTRTADGSSGPEIEPPQGSCDACRVEVDAVDLGDESLVVVARIAAAGNPRPPELEAFALGRDGGATPRALPPLVDGAQLPRFDVIDRQLVLVGRSAVVPIDHALAVSGPVLPRPNPVDTVVSFAGEPAVAWTNRGGDAGEPGPEPDLLFRLFDREGHPIAPVRRATTTLRVAAVGRSGDRIGILHRSSQSYFSLSRLSGDKIGGDLALGTKPSTDDRVVGLPDGNFRVLSAEGNRIVRREIVCAP